MGSAPELRDFVAALRGIGCGAARWIDFGDSHEVERQGALVEGLRKLHLSLGMRARSLPYRSTTIEAANREGAAARVQKRAL